MSPWTGRVNAEVYDRFVRDHLLYHRLNHHLAELAELRDARRVLDLACGTGATALACLRLMDFDADLLGIDASEDMVAVARANILDPRARFRVAAAAAVDRVPGGPFDRAVCNAAFWQFPSAGDVLRALAAVLSRGARFVFNLPAAVVRGEPAPVHPFQIALGRAVEAKTGRVFSGAQAALDADHLVELLAECGFDILDRHRFTYEGRQGELMELMTIPAMLARLAPDLPKDERREAMQEARERADPREPVRVPWLYFVSRRSPRRPAPPP
jgi:ubiquinone/menaquinone biosynthesis C-methylase UbiE